MPITRVMRSPMSELRSTPMRGIPPATAASNAKSTPLVFSQGEQLLADVGDELLVGRDDGLASPERRGYEMAGGLDAAHRLHDDIHIVRHHQ